MFLKKAEAKNFRNYSNFSVEFSSPINVFIGENGQGKSSFLEALYCALRGKSFQSFVSSQFIKNGKNQTEIHLEIEEEEGKSTISSRFFLSENSLKKELFYCNKKVGPLFLRKKFPIFVFTEESLKCIRQGPEQRRLFIDEMLYSPDSKSVKEEFNRCLKQKKQLLKSVRQGFLPRSEGEKTLKALNPRFLEASFRLVEERLKLLKRLFSSLKELKAQFFKEPLPELGFSYLFDGENELKKEGEIQGFLELDLDKKKEEEIRAGIPLSGPQKHEIRFLFNSQDSRTFCSKGQQRIFILSLLASHIQSFPEALLLLDDALSELDEKSQNKFLKFLEKNHCQTFLTNCKLIGLKTKKMSFFSVKNGIIERYE